MKRKAESKHRGLNGAADSDTTVYSILLSTYLTGLNLQEVGKFSSFVELIFR